MVKPSMDGTQRPTKIAAFSSPLNHNISEKIRERKAAVNSSRSAIDNFFVIQFFSSFLTDLKRSNNPNVILFLI